MSIPHFEFPDSPVIAGDKRDNDAEIIDSLVESDAEPPKPEELPRGPYRELETPKNPTRLMTGRMNVDKAWAAPTLLVPADPNRKSLHIVVMSSTATDMVRFSDEQNKAQSTEAFFQPVYGGGFDMSNHTGAVWVWAPDAAAVVTVSFVAVTK